MHWAIIQMGVTVIGIMVGLGFYHYQHWPIWACLLVVIGFGVLARKLAKRFGQLCSGF